MTMWGWIGEYSVVPTIVVETETFRIRTVNAAARSLLNRDSGSLLGVDMRSLYNPDDVESLEEALGACARTVGATRYKRHRFMRPSDSDVTTEMSLVGCGPDENQVTVALMQMRDATADPSLAAFVRLLADDPDGDQVVRAIVDGPLARLPIRLGTVTVVDRTNRRLIQVGSFGLDRDDVRAYHLSPMSHSHPVGVSALNTQTVRLSLRAVAENYPLMSVVARRQPSFESGEMIAMPVLSRGIAIGVLFLSADRPMPRTWQFHEMLLSISQALAPWILLRIQSVLSEPAGSVRASVFFISERERTVVGLVKKGMTNFAIAEQLGYSEATIRADLGRLSKMLGVSGRREIVRRVAELGL